MLIPFKRNENIFLLNFEDDSKTTHFVHHYNPFLHVENDKIMVDLLSLATRVPKTKCCIKLHGRTFKARFFSAHFRSLNSYDHKILENMLFCKIVVYFCLLFSREQRELRYI